MATLSSINIRIGANLKEFSTKLQNAERGLKKFGKNMEKTGKNLSRNLTLPLVGLAAVGVKVFAEQEQAVAKLSAQISQSGQDVNTVLPYYQKFASDLQQITTVGDEATLGLIQMAMTMGSSAPEIAAKNAIALSKALGVDLNSAIKMVTLAEKGEYTMLNRYVPALRSATTESEKAAITQKLYADGLEIAKAEAETSTGKMIQLKNTFGDLMEAIGGVISRALVPLVERLKSLAERFQGLSDTQLKWIVTIGGIVAAIGPLLILIGKMSLGLKALIPIFVKLFAVMAANPIMLVVAAAGALALVVVKVIQNWEGVTIFFKKIFYKLRIIVAKGVSAILKPIDTLLSKLDIEFKGYDNMQAMIEDAHKQLKILDEQSKKTTVDISEGEESAEDYADAINKIVSSANNATTSLNNTSKATQKFTKAQLELAKTIGDEKLGVQKIDLVKPDTSGLLPQIAPKAESADNMSKIRDEAMGQDAAITSLTKSVMNYSEALGAAITNGKEFGNVMRQIALDFVKQRLTMAIAATITDLATKLGVAAIPLAGAAAAGITALFDKLVPQFATGTSYAPGGLSLVGERGAELVNLPRGSQVMTADRTRGMDKEMFLYSVISGDNIYLSNKRNMTKRGRIN